MKKRTCAALPDRESVFMVTFKGCMADVAIAEPVESSATVMGPTSKVANPDRSTLTHPSWYFLIGFPDSPAIFPAAMACCVVNRADTIVAGAPG
jgi:hypothetical protein